MIIFAVTNQGFLELEPVIRTGRYHIWIGSNVLSELALNNYREQELKLLTSIMLLTLQIKMSWMMPFIRLLSIIQERGLIECMPQI